MLDLRRVAAVLAAALSIFLLAGPAAAEQSEFDAIVAEALERYQARAFLEAADLFMRAYEIRQEPELIFNTARAYERAGDTERAMAAYERFLELENTTASLRARAAENLSALREEQLARERAARLEEETHRRREAAARGEGEGEGEGGGEGGGGEGGGEGRTEEDRAAFALTVTGWTLVGVGAAALVGAGITAGLAYSGYREFQDMEVEDDRLSVRDRVEQESLAADILFGVGGGVAAAGIVILVVQAVQAAGAAGGAEGIEGGEGGQPEVSILPSISPEGGVALVAVGRF